MTAWSEQRTAVEKRRGERTKDWENALIVQLKRAVDTRICDRFAPHHVKREDRLIEIKKGSGHTVKAKSREVPAIALQNLPAIEDAKLSFVVTLQKDKKRIEQYTVSAVGREKKSGRP